MSGHAWQLLGNVVKSLCKSQIASFLLSDTHNSQNTVMESVMEKFSEAMPLATSLAANRNDGIDSSCFILLSPRLAYK